MTVRCLFFLCAPPKLAFKMVVVIERMLENEPFIARIGIHHSYFILDNLKINIFA